jgi:hypothetical protein
METTMTILVLMQIGVMLAYSYFEKITDSKWIKNFKIYGQFNSEKYLEVDELQEIERNKEGLHTWGAVPKVIASAILPLTLVALTVIEFESIFLILTGLCINWLMDVHLNIIMKWGTWYRSKKRMMDSAPFLIRLAILGVCIALVYFV